MWNILLGIGSDKFPLQNINSKDYHKESKTDNFYHKPYNIAATHNISQWELVLKDYL
jgi:hypothetical protein